MSLEGIRLTKNRMTFFSMTTPRTKKEKPKLHASDEANRKIITAMLASDDALTAYEIAARAKTGRGNTYTTLQDFVKAGLATTETKAIYQNIKHNRFRLTEHGLDVAVAVGFETRDLPSAVYEKALRKTMQPNPKHDPLKALLMLSFLNSLDRGCLEACMEVNYHGAVSRERMGDKQASTLQVFSVRHAYFDKIETLRQCILNAIPFMTEADMRVVRSYVKTSAEGLGFQIAATMLDDRKEVMETLTESSQDPDRFIFNFKCTLCGYLKMHAAFPTNEMVVDALLNRGPKCPNCGKYPYDAAALMKDKRFGMKLDKLSLARMLPRA